MAASDAFSTYSKLKILAIFNCVEELCESDLMLNCSDNFLPVLCMASTIVKESRPKVQGFMENVVNRMTDSEFRRHFRVTSTTYRRLLEDIRVDLIKHYRGGYYPVSPELQLLIFLWFASNQDSQREIALLFGVSEYSVNVIVKHVAEVICERSYMYIKMPNMDMEDTIATNFEHMCGIPNIVGAIDGTHIPIFHCPGSEVDYINRKNFASVQLQLIVDDRLLINNAYVGWPGCTHDARVLRNSKVYETAEEGTVISPGRYLIGDSAYPLRRWLLTPYRDNGHLSAKQKKFNTALSRARQCVERTNAHLKGRFRRLNKVYFKDVSDICKLTLACCVLLNLCILCDDEIDDFIDMNMAVNVNNYQNIFHNLPSAAATRDAIAAAM